MSQLHSTYLRQLPAVDEVIREAATRPWITQYARRAVTDAVRHVLQTLRQAILQTVAPDVLEALPLALPAIVQQVGS